MVLGDVLPMDQGPGIQNTRIQDKQEQPSPCGDSHEEDINMWAMFALTRRQELVSKSKQTWG